MSTRYQHECTSRVTRCGIKGHQSMIEEEDSDLSIKKKHLIVENEIVKMLINKLLLSYCYNMVNY